ncbi:MAG: serine/threonine-protein kinase [Myxococcota bacterium]
MPPRRGHPSDGDGLPRVGDVLDGRYRITGVLGSGGMGCVYRAEHLAIGRPLALKFLRPEVEGIAGISERFRREAFAIGRVDHPNCVNVSDFGQLEDGTLYMVLEVLDGTSLFDLMAEEHRLDWRRALHISRHVLSALGYAHGAGIVHRDVKPENVILVEQGGDPDFAKILDFGIAKLFDEAQAEAGNPGLTQLGVTIGTPTYIAPEQAFGQPVDARADLYSLSVMLFEMVAGAPPFDADDVLALLTMHATAEVPRLADVASGVGVPQPVEALVRLGLEKKPEDRIPDAATYIAKIDALLGDDTLESSPRQGDIDAGSQDGVAWFEGAMTMAQDVRHSIAPAVARAATGIRSMPRRRKRRTMLATIGLIAGFLAIVVLGLGQSGPDYLPTRTRLPLMTPKHGPEAEAAARMLEQGKPKEAAAYLQSRGGKVHKEPYAQLVLGHAHAAAQRNLQALQAYERAIALEPGLGKDKLLRTNLDLMSHKGDARVVAASLAILGALAKNGDKDARKRLVELASQDLNLVTRRGAMSVASASGLGDRVDWLRAYSLDLQQGRTCADRRDAVANLRALGDKAAIPVLVAAQQRSRTEGLLKRKVNANACLRQDAAEAVQYLKSI